MRNRHRAAFSALTVAILLVLSAAACTDERPAPDAGQAEGFTPTSLRDQAVEMGTEGLVAPVLVERVLPEYTPQATRAGVEGEVYIEAVVTVEGAVVEPKLIKGLGHEELDQRAMRAITRWRFEAGTLDEEPVPVIALFTITYRIH